MTVSALKGKAELGFEMVLSFPLGGTQRLEYVNWAAKAIGVSLFGCF